MPQEDVEKRREYGRAYKKRHPDRVKASRRRDYLKRKLKIQAYHKEWAAKNHRKLVDQHYTRKCAKLYGVTIASYKRLMDAQDSRCAICRVHALQARYARLCVDHDHRTNEVRGLLCDRCNRALGRAGDDIGLLWTAIQYLQKYKVVRDVA